MNKVVARYADGRVVKGSTADFFPAKPLFHLTPVQAPPGALPTEICLADLKAVIFVKDFSGDPSHVDRNDFDPSRPAPGRKIRVRFNDGEVLVGTTAGYKPGRPGFFLEPADASSNTQRCYIVAQAAESVGFI